MFADGELDMFSLCSNSIYFSLNTMYFSREIRYVAQAQRVSMAPLLCYFPRFAQRAKHIEREAPYRVADISSDASAAHIDVESSFKNGRLD
jgi:hypothetical protein